MRTSHEMNTRASSTFVPGYQQRTNRYKSEASSDQLLDTLKAFGKSKGWMFLLELPGGLFLSTSSARGGILPVEPTISVTVCAVR